MKGSLLDSLKMIQPHIPPFMLNAGNLARIDQIASVLPAIHRAGFEYRLGSKNGGVDFQQGIALNAEETSRLPQIASPGSTLPGDLSGFSGPLANWIKSINDPASHLHSSFKQLWLEFDCAEYNKDYLKASIFLALSYKFSNLVLASEAVCHAYESLSGKPVDAATRATLLRVFQSAGPGGVTHAGFMLGRIPAELRLVAPVKNSNALKSLLISAGWVGDIGTSTRYWRWLDGLFPETRICIDLASGTAHRLGFECFFTPAGEVLAQDARMANIFAALASKKLCDPREIAFMKEWPGCVYPQDSAHHWPDDITFRSISSPEHCFLMLERRLSHLKFSEIETSKPRAKLYFGYFEKLCCLQKPVNNGA